LFAKKYFSEVFKISEVHLYRTNGPSYLGRFRTICSHMNEASSALYELFARNLTYENILEIKQMYHKCDSDNIQTTKTAKVETFPSDLRTAAADIWQCCAIFAITQEPLKLRPPVRYILRKFYTPGIF